MLLILVAETGCFIIQEAMEKLRREKVAKRMHCSVSSEKATAVRRPVYPLSKFDSDSDNENAEDHEKH